MSSVRGVQAARGRWSRAAERRFVRQRRGLKLTGNSLARAVFALFGVLLIVEFFLNLGGAFSSAPLVLTTGEVQPSTFLSNAGASLVVRVAAGFFFNLIPGGVLLYYGAAWADRLVPPMGEAESYVEFTALLSIGLTLLGYYLAVSGIAGLAAGAVSVGFADEYGREFAWRQTASSIAMLVSGVVVAALGRRAA